MKPKYTSVSTKLQPLVSILRREVVAMVSGRMLLMYCSNWGIPSTGHMTPVRRRISKLVENVRVVKFIGNKTIRVYDEI